MMVNVEKVRELLYGDEEYMKEFAVAAVDSYSEFRDHFARALEVDDMELLRNAGHKIKPSAQMLDFEAVLEEYELGKGLLEEGADEAQRKESVERMTGICNQIIEEMKELA